MSAEPVIGSEGIAPLTSPPVSGNLLNAPHPIFQGILDGALRANARAEVLAAEYTVAGRGRPAVLTINRINAGRRETFSTHEVSGKREARWIAATLNAKPWNF